FEADNSTAATGTLVIEGGSAQSVNFAIGQGGNGSVTIDGTQVGFSGVQSVVDGIQAANLDIALADGGQTWSLGDGAQAGELMLQSSAGAQMTFADPSGSLIIDSRAAGANAGDTLQLGNIDLPATAAFTVLGRPSDTVNVTGNIRLGGQNLTISA